ncbi:MAG: hypothetical protein OMM_02262 [Candidatus Magnetoglobus multicellularis str. Araruama]|uniref:Conserved hypothetical protein CHP03032 domain-containing protein n=1 Tax=Candidatus Magnetoglobus multicellularis str. Araruama TaxID=890399 RepID=A0A1V1P9Y6_9BACT|nr:MAG: hypothetical protein OMM_02262 [Candidatus Magnetoglobus multicellularis str. Araruama]
MDKLLITCTNDDKDGGIYLWEINRGTISRIYEYQCMGISRYKNYYAIASQSLEQNTMYLDGIPNGHFQHSIICLDNKFNIASEAPVSIFGMGDLHDIIVFDSKVWVVDTIGNRIIVFQITNKYKKGCLPFGYSEFIFPLLEWRDPNAQEPDSSHMNGICITKKNIIVSAFGRFSKYREYVNRRDDGCIMDITDLFKPFGMSQTFEEPRIVKNKIYDPHSIVMHDNDLYYVESKKRRIVKNWQTLLEFDLGYVRGLFIRKNFLFVGFSKSRHSDTDENFNCNVLMLDIKNHNKKLNSANIPSKEIYSFVNVLP